MILAQSISEADPAHVYQWFIIAGAVVVMANQLFDIFRKIKGEPENPPYHRQFADAQATRDQFEKIEDQLDEIRMQAARDKSELASKIENIASNLSQEGSRRASNINQRVDKLGQELVGALGELKGEVKQMNERLKDI